MFKESIDNYSNEPLGSHNIEDYRLKDVNKNSAISGSDSNFDAAIEKFSSVQYRKPTVFDGVNIHDLVSNCPPLDENSLYCNCLQATHFAQTSAVAHQDMDHSLLGLVSGYRLPDDNKTLFIWQIAVAEQARGQRLALKLLVHLLERLHRQHAFIQFIETTITDNNQASWNTFDALAKFLGAEKNISIGFDETSHFGGRQATENKLTIGPIDWHEKKHAFATFLSSFN